MSTAAYSAHSFEIDGRLLKRGFWVYAVRIQVRSRLFVYVGRTGDTSSPNASPPLSRVSAHFNLKDAARGNSLVRNLKKRNISPQACRYSFFAVGPIYPEASSMHRRRPVRDRMAALEASVARLLSDRGYTVLGAHPRLKPLTRALPRSVLKVFSS